MKITPGIDLRRDLEDLTPLRDLDRARVWFLRLRGRSEARMV